MVIGERCIDDGAEWRTFVDDSSNGRADPNRCGECPGECHVNFLLSLFLSETRTAVPTAPVFSKHATN